MAIFWTILLVKNVTTNFVLLVILLTQIVIFFANQVVKHVKLTVIVTLVMMDFM